MTEFVELVIPAEPDFVTIARVFITEAARDFGAAEEAVLDVQLAVSEACSWLIESSTHEQIVVSARGQPSPMVEITGMGGLDSLPQDAQEGRQPLSLNIILAMFPDAYVGSSIRFTVGSPS